MRTRIFLPIVYLLWLHSTAQTQAWVPIKSSFMGPDTAVPPAIWTLTGFDGNLIVAGSFGSVAGVEAHSIARWDGTEWHSLAGGLTASNAPNNEIRAVLGLGTDLYAGGEFDSIGGIRAKNVARWDGFEWHAVDETIKAFPVHAMFVYQGELYVSGVFDMAVAKLVNGSWVRVGSDTDYAGGSSMTVFQNDLYVGGFERVMKWNGSSWSVLGLNPWPEHIYAALATFGNSLYASVYSPYNTNLIARFKDGVWEEILTPRLHKSYGAFSNFGSTLIAGGTHEAFDTSDGVVPANGLAVWDGSSWHSGPGGVQAIVSGFTIIDSTLYAAGSFQFEGDSATYGVARLLLPNDVTGGQPHVPREFALGQNYPNPFNPSTTFTFSLPSKAFVSLKVFDELGREVSTVFAQEMPPGVYSRHWNADGLSSGTYFYRLRAGSISETRKLIVVR